MCTAITLQTQDFYFGRNLDLDCGYGEGVVITPRNYPFVFRNGQRLNRHLAIIGMGVVADGFPLYFDATNEAGLSIAGLNFPDNAVYRPKDHDLDNIAPYELIPWLLGRYRSVDEAMGSLKRMNLWATPFSGAYSLTPLHWMLADRKRALVLEPTQEGLKVFDNPVGVLTNNPPFEYHMHNLSRYANLTVSQPRGAFWEVVGGGSRSLGLGLTGLPGDPSSASRFVRAALMREYSVCDVGEAESVSRFFHILSGVAQVRGMNCIGENRYEYTIYSSCCNAAQGIYYYTTYSDSRIRSVRLHDAETEGKHLVICARDDIPQFAERVVPIPDDGR